jgi:hypothetical protein
MSRGIEGRRICADDGDRDRWLDILGRASERFGWKVLAFCLLDNPVSKAVHGLVLGSDAFVKKVRKLVEYYRGRSPMKLGLEEEVKKYLHHLIEDRKLRVGQHVLPPALVRVKSHLPDGRRGI